MNNDDDPEPTNGASMLPSVHAILRSPAYVTDAGSAG